jgi:hypothetical protein
LLVDWGDLPPKERKSNMAAIAAMAEILALGNREVRRVDRSGPRRRRKAARPDPVSLPA